MFLVFNSDYLGFHYFTKGSVSLGNVVTVGGLSDSGRFQCLGSIFVAIARASVVHCNHRYFWLQKTEYSRKDIIEKMEFSLNWRTKTSIARPHGTCNW